MISADLLFLATIGAAALVGFLLGRATDADGELTTPVEPARRPRKEPARRL